MSWNGIWAAVQQCVGLCSLKFYLWGHLKKIPQFRHLQLKMKTLHQNIFHARQAIRKHPAHLKGCDSPCVH